MEFSVCFRGKVKNGILTGPKGQFKIPYTLQMVGAAGIEPATFCSQSRRAEPLRYAPKNDNYIKYSLAVNDSKAQNNLLQFFINDRPPRKQTATRCNGKIPPDASATENYSSVTSSFFT